MQELLEARSMLRNDGTTPLPAGALKVEVNAVTFGYDADEPVIEELSLKLTPGRVVGVLGRTGSGKTTLTRLLQRLYEPQQGTIRLGGVDIGATPLEEVRRRVGVVTQEVQLFQATVRDNLTFFDGSISNERVLAAIERLGLRPWFDTLPAGLDTELASGSGGLSAGEGQLLAFTRIFLREPGLNHPGRSFFAARSGYRTGEAEGALDELLATSDEMQRLWHGELDSETAETTTNAT